MAGKGGKRPGAGRPKGSPNKATADVRAAIVEAFEKRNTDKQWLEKLDDKTFAALVAKVVPNENINRNYDMNTIQQRLAEGRERVANMNRKETKDAKQKETVRRRA